jgi:Mg-chelatase subunit ChlD
MSLDPTHIPGDQAEALLTALLLGELPEADAVALRRALEQDVRLAGLYERLKLTVDLVRETTASPAEETAAQPAPLKLADERRQKLLAHFKTVSPAEFRVPPGRQMSWVVPMSIAAVLVAIIGARVLAPGPFFFRARQSSQAAAVANNVRMIEGGKDQWALEHKKNPGDTPTPAELADYFKGGALPRSVAGETYQINPVGTPAATARPGRREKGAVISSSAAPREDVFTDNSSRQPPPSSGPTPVPLPASAPTATPPATAKRTEIVLPSGGQTANAENAQLETRSFHMDPNALMEDQGIRRIFPSVELAQNSAGVGGGGGVGGGVFDLPRRDAELGVPRVDVAGGFAGGQTAGAERGNAGQAIASSNPERISILETSSSLPNGPASLFVSRDAKPVAEAAKNPEVPASKLAAQNSALPASSQINPATGLAEAGVTATTTPPPASIIVPPDNSTVAFEVTRSRNEGKSMASAPPNAPALGDVAGLGTRFREEEAAGRIVARTPFALKPAASAPTAGDDLSSFGLASNITSSGDKRLRAPAAAPGQEASKDVAFTFDLNRNGTADQPEGGGRATDQSGVSNGRFTDRLTTTVNRATGTADQVPPPLGERSESETASEGAIRRSVGQLQTAETLARQNPPSSADRPPEFRRMMLQRDDAKKEIDRRDVGAATGLEKQKDAAAAKLEALDGLGPKTNVETADAARRKPSAPAPVPQLEIQTRENAFSTFSLNVADVSFKLAAASLEKGVMPEPTSVRSEEFINAFDYRDPEPPTGAPIGFAWERAHYPFAHNRDLLRFSVKTAAAGRQPGRPLNLVLLLDNSGSMERADRVRIIHEALRLLAAQLQSQDRFSVVTFARTAQLRVDGVSGDQAGAVAEQLSGQTPEGGTNLEEAMNLAYQTALRHYLAAGINRVVLLTDGAANLGNVDPETLKQKVEAHRKQGVALDCFGIGWEGYNDDLLEVLSRNGDGRYGFLNTPEEAATEFAGQLAGALHVAASDVKVQVEFNPARVTAYRQVGYAKHQLTKEQFRDNTVDAAEIGAAESGNALYVVEVNPAGEGPLAVVRVRYRVPGTADYPEHEWAVPYSGNAPVLEQSGPALRLAAAASAFSEWLVSSPYAAEVSPDRLLGYLAGVPEVYGADARPKKLEWMIRQAKSLSGRDR